MSKKEIIVFTLIILVFLGLHIFGVNLSYHQDEYKWIYYSHPEIIPPGTVPHPPLTEFIYTTIGPLVGDDNFRLIPFVFGFINLFLVFILAKIIFDKRTALWAAFLFATSFYSLLATLMVDVDGAVMPFFFLLLAIGYFKLKQSDWKDKKWLWFIIAGALGGFLVKVSGLLPVFAVALDFAVSRGVFKDKKKILKFAVYGFLGFVACILILFASKFVFPSFDLTYSFTYWKHFIVSDRGWFQTFIQCAKAILYTSPMLLLLSFLIKKEFWPQIRVFVFFILSAFIFYVILFDFSIGALDRYWQLLVVPLVLLSAKAITQSLNLDDRKTKEFLFLGIIAGLIIFLLQYIPHFVPSLHPKSEWISRIINLKWNFLFPFTGGSGPTGFYVSFLFMSLSWIISAMAIGISFWKPHAKKLALVFILPIAISYNFVFIEEYLFGKINGSPYDLFEEAKNFIVENDDIKQVAVYNDIGGYDIQQTGKYFRRIYVAPQFDSTYQDIFAAYRGHVLFIDIPRVDQNSLYSKYISSCTSIYEKRDKYISANIFDCRNSSL